MRSSFLVTNPTSSSSCSSLQGSRGRCYYLIRTTRRRRQQQRRRFVKLVGAFNDDDERNMKTSTTADVIVKEAAIRAEEAKNKALLQKVKRLKERNDMIYIDKEKERVDMN